MQATMRALVLVASLALSHGAATSAGTASPIAKVVEMISELQSKVLKEGEAAQKVYAEFAEWCEDRSKDLGFEIKTGTADVESLKAVIAEQEALVSSLDTKLEELAAGVATSEADLKAATAIRAKEQKDFVAEETELTEVIDMLERAIGILEREMAGGASMLQAKNANSVMQALEIMAQAAVIGSADAAKLTAFVQSAQGSEDSELGAPAAAVYEGQSGGVVNTLQDLLEKAEAQLGEVRGKETAALHNYEMLKQSLTDEIKFATKDMDEAKKGLAAGAERKSTAEGDLAVTSRALAADVEAKAELHHDCMSKATDFESETKSRGEELNALAEAKKIITDMTDGAAAQSYSFLQTARVARAASRLQLAHYEVVHLVRDLARKHHAAALAQLASRINAAMHSGAADPFEKVRGLIADMLSKLESEAEADATQKAYCDKEMSETGATKSDKSDGLEKLSTKIEQMSAESAKLKEEVAALQAELAKLTKSQAEMDQLRQKEHELYTTNKADMEMGLEGVKKALAVLKEYYGREDKAHGAAEGASTGIIGLLEVCESDFSKDLAEIVSVEETAAASYEEETKENEIETKTKEQDVKYKTRESKSLDKAASETSADTETAKTELDAVLEYYDKIKAMCVAKPEAYETRVQRRTAEIAGLKEALTILESEAAFVQERSSHHRALRGVRRHV